MKLLYLLPEYVHNTGGGISTFYHNFLPLLAAQGHKVRVIVGSGVFAKTSADQVFVDGISVETLERSLLDKYYRRFTNYAALPGLRRFLAGAWAMWEQADRGEGYDVVEATDWGLLFLPWVLEKGPPTIVQMHGSIGQIDWHDPLGGEEVQGNLIRLIERVSIPLAKAIQAGSRVNADFWSKQCGIQVERILPAWRPIQSYNELDARVERGLVVGRVQRWKGPEILCEALQLLGEESPAVDWLGRDVPFETKTQSTSNYLRKTWPSIWGKKIQRWPQQSVEHTASLQAEARFVVVPSLWDTFNYTAVEAMGACTPVICSSGAGASELIDDGITGFVFENGNASSLANAIKRLLALSASDLRILAEAGRNVVLDKLDPVKVCEQRLLAYDTTLNSNRCDDVSTEDWLRKTCSPAKSDHDIHEFLNQLPLREIATNAVQRALKKVWR